MLLAIWMGVSGAAAGLERGKLIVKVTAERAKMLEGARGETGAILVDVSQVTRDFEGLSGWVEYAEPDRRVEVQGKSRE